MWLNSHSFISGNFPLLGLVVSLDWYLKNRLLTAPVPNTDCSFVPSTLDKDHQSAMHPIPIPIL
jgi:hypothetical protein